MRFFIFLILIIGCHVTSWANTAAPWVGKDFQGLPCQGAEMNYGPFDYTNQQHRETKLPIVEKYHFKPEVEQLINSTAALNNLEYTLRAFPNHHRALSAVIRFYIRELKKSKSGTTISDISRKFGKTPPECHLQKAIKFSPKDGTVYTLLGIYTHRLNMLEEAEAAYKKGAQLSPKSSEAHYNYGLLLAQLKRYDDALTEARIAYKLGYPLPGLKRRLQAAGYDLSK